MEWKTAASLFITNKGLDLSRQNNRLAGNKWALCHTTSHSPYTISKLNLWLYKNHINSSFVNVKISGLLSKNYVDICLFIFMDLEEHMFTVFLVNTV